MKKKKYIVNNFIVTIFDYIMDSDLESALRTTGFKQLVFKCIE